jgi:hypothetical protein
MVLIMPKLDRRVRERAGWSAPGWGEAPLGASPESTLPGMSARRAANRLALANRVPGSEGNA